MKYGQVLVVDDEVRWQAEVKLILNDLGCKVHLASNYEDARFLLGQAQYDFVVSDNRMPPVSNAGLELLAWVRLEKEPLKSMPFVLYTSSTFETTLKMCADLGGIYHEKHGRKPLIDILRPLVELQ